jgi:hypothetical protein
MQNAINNGTGAEEKNHNSWFIYRPRTDGTVGHGTPITSELRNASSMTRTRQTGVAEHNSNR